MKKITLLFLLCMLSIYSMQAGNTQSSSPLYNNSWIVGRMNEVTINPQYTMIVYFGDMVGGNAYCNDFLAPFADLGNNQIYVGMLRLTKKVCPQSDMENIFVRLFQSADNYKLDGSILTLRSGSNVVLEFYPYGSACPWPYDSSQEPQQPEVPSEPEMSGYQYHYDVSGNRTLRETIYLIKGKSAMAYTKSGAEEQDIETIKEYERPVEQTLGSSDFKIYPNPTKGMLKIDISGENHIQNTLIEVYNRNGKTVYSTKDTRTSYQIDLSNQSDGVYIMRIVVDNTPYEWKIIKE